MAQGLIAIVQRCDYGSLHKFLSWARVLTLGPGAYPVHSVRAWSQQGLFSKRSYDADRLESKYREYVRKEVDASSVSDKT